MYRLKKIKPFSIAKIMGFLMGVIGLIPSVILLFIIVLKLLFSGLFTVLSPDSSNAYPLLSGGISSLIFVMLFSLLIPVFYWMMGFIMGLFYGYIYNLSSKLLGGLEFEIEKTDQNN